MTKERADEIVRLTFYKHINNLKSVLCDEDDSEASFSVGRYIGMMQRDLEKELEKEVTKDEEMIKDLEEYLSENDGEENSGFIEVCLDIVKGVKEE